MQRTRRASASSRGARGRSRSPRGAGPRAPRRRSCRSPCRSRRANGSRRSSERAAQRALARDRRAAVSSPVRSRIAQRANPTAIPNPPPTAAREGGHREVAPARLDRLDERPEARPPRRRGRRRRAGRWRPLRRAAASAARAAVVVERPLPRRGDPVADDLRAGALGERRGRRRASRSRRARRAPPGTRPRSAAIVACDPVGLVARGHDHDPLGAAAVAGSGGTAGYSAADRDPAATGGLTWPRSRRI